MDGVDNLLVSDTFNNRIRKVDATTGIITTVVGIGERGLVGDGGLATEAALNNPRGLLVDGDGNMLISDSGNSRVRKVDATTGIITTVAGTGKVGFSGDGGPVTEAAVGTAGIALDSNGNLFIVHALANRIRRVDATTGIITTVAGSGPNGLGTGSFSGDGGPATGATLNAPLAVAVDAEGNLFIADRSNGRIRRVDAATGLITTVAGSGKLGFTGDGGPATEADFFEPWAVAIDPAGNLFITDHGNKRIRVVRGIAPPGASPGIGPGPPGPDAKEPNDNAAEATAVLCDDSLADVSIRPLGDVDFYAVSLSAGETLSVDIDARELGSSLDPVLGISDTDGTTLLDSSDDDPAPGESSSLDSYLQFLASAEGTYFIAVSAFSDLDFDGTDGKSSGSYTISFQCQAGGAGPGRLR